LSYDDGLSPYQRVGCIVLGLLAAAFVVMMFFGAALADCADDANGTGCENDWIIRPLMFPGSLILLILVGIIAARHVTKDKD
jgi:hypothetical protein